MKSLTLGDGGTSIRIAQEDVPGGAVVKRLPANAGDTRNLSPIPGSGRSPGIGNGNTLQYYCLENSLGRGARRATVHGATESQTQPSARTGGDHSQATTCFLCLSFHVSGIKSNTE